MSQNIESEKNIQKNTGKNIFIDKFFLSYTDEEIWLNKMAESGLYLVKKSFYRYSFVRNEKLDVKYTVELLDHPASNPLSADYIEAKRRSGVELVAHYKCRAYFKMSKETYRAEAEVAKKTRTKSVCMMFGTFSLAFIASVLMLCYHCVASLNFTVEASGEKMSALTDEFSFFGIFEKISRLIKLDSLLGDYQSTPMALMFFIAVVIFSIPVAVYFREMFLNCEKKKTKTPKTESKK